MSTPPNPAIRPREAAASGGGSDDGVALGADPVAHLVSLTLAEAVTKTERLFAWLRGAFCVVMCVGFFLTARRDSATYSARALLELGVAVLGIATSVWLVRRLAHAPLSEGLLVASVSVDAVLCIAALAGNVFARYEGYDGLLEGVDVAIVPLIVLSAIFRVSRRAVLTSAGLCGLGVIALVALDVHHGLALDASKATLFGVYFGTAVALALFATQRTREIFERVGNAAVRAEGARSSVFGLLRDHHDLRSVLCDLQLQADRLVEAQGAPDEERVEKVQRLQGSLQRTIEQLSDATQKTRDRALSTLSGLGDPSPADVSQALALARDSLPQHLSLKVHDAVSPCPRVTFGGGTEGLSRLLTHLLVNAAEGDGGRGAANVHATLNRSPGPFCEIVLEDDGPGFPPEVLRVAGRSHGTSAKPGSAGIGLWLSRSTLLAVGGGLELRNTNHGARVALRLPIRTNVVTRRDGGVAAKRDSTEPRR